MPTETSDDKKHEWSQHRLCSWTHKMSQTFKDSAFSTPCQLRAMWLCLYLQEKALYNEGTVKNYHMMVVCMPLAGERACGTHLTAVVFLSSLFFCFPNFLGKPGQRVWDCATKWFILLSTGIMVQNYVVTGETPSELVKASPHQREAPQGLGENQTGLWGRSCSSLQLCSHEQAVLLSWKPNRQEYFPFFSHLPLPRPSCSSPQLP